MLSLKSIQQTPGYKLVRVIFLLTIVPNSSLPQLSSSDLSRQSKNRSQRSWLLTHWPLRQLNSAIPHSGPVAQNGHIQQIIWNTIYIKLILRQLIHFKSVINTRYNPFTDQTSNTNLVKGNDRDKTKDQSIYYTGCPISIPSTKTLEIN